MYICVNTCCIFIKIITCTNELKSLQVLSILMYIYMPTAASIAIVVDTSESMRIPHLSDITASMLPNFVLYIVDQIYYCERLQ